MEDILVPIGVVGMLFIGLPWLILHYSTQWKRAGSITREDEDLLDELYDTARRLDDRMNTIERIMAADNPEWARNHFRGVIEDFTVYGVQLGAGQVAGLFGEEPPVALIEGGSGSKEAMPSAPLPAEDVDKVFGGLGAFSV